MEGWEAFIKGKPASVGTMWPRLEPSMSSASRSEVIWHGAERERCLITRWGAAKVHREGD